MGTQCPRCGEYDVMWMPHDPETGATTAQDDEGLGHSYCRNCDYGVCEFC